MGRNRLAYEATPTRVLCVSVRLTHSVIRESQWLVTLGSKPLSSNSIAKALSGGGSAGALSEPALKVMLVALIKAHDACEFLSLNCPGGPSNEEVDKGEGRCIASIAKEFRWMLMLLALACYS